MSLIDKIHKALEHGDLQQPFAVEDLKQWIKSYQITKDDGEDYAEFSINVILSNSDIKNVPTTNKNTKLLKSRVNGKGKHEYWL